MAPVPTATGGGWDARIPTASQCRRAAAPCFKMEDRQVGGATARTVNLSFKGLVTRHSSTTTLKATGPTGNSIITVLRPTGPIASRPPRWLIDLQRAMQPKTEYHVRASPCVPPTSPFSRRLRTTGTTSRPSCLGNTNTLTLGRIGPCPTLDRVV